MGVKRIRSKERKDGPRGNFPTWFIIIIIIITLGGVTVFIVIQSYINLKKVLRP